MIEWPYVLALGVASVLVVWLVCRARSLPRRELWTTKYGTKRDWFDRGER